MFTNNFLQTLLRVLLSALLVGGMTITAVNAVDGNPPGLFELDGNTVETHVEQAAYAQNAVDYQASLRFLDYDWRLNGRR